MSDARQQPSSADDSTDDAGLPHFAPGVIDDWVAANIRVHREQLDMSQADVAEKMAALGWKYYPQTVHRIESGQRKVTVGEAQALARIFNTTVDGLTWPDLAKNAAAWFDMFTDRADEAFTKIAVQVRELLFAREHLAQGVADAEQRGIGNQETVRQSLERARATLDNATPETAVEVGRADYGEWFASVRGDIWATGGWPRLLRYPEENSDVES